MLYLKRELVTKVIAIKDKDSWVVGFITDGISANDESSEDSLIVEPMGSDYRSLLRWEFQPLNNGTVQAALKDLTEWVTTMFPNYVKVGDLAWYRPDQDVVIKENDRFNIHPASGVLFRITYPEGLKGDTGITYECLDQNEEYLWDIENGIAGKDVELFHYALVRRNTPKGWGYYPLPLIYASKEEREIAAEQMGTKTPSERWVRRRRQAVEALLQETFEY